MLMLAVAAETAASVTDMTIEVIDSMSIVMVVVEIVLSGGDEVVKSAERCWVAYILMESERLGSLSLMNHG